MSDWNYRIGDQQFGPVTSQEMKRLILEEKVEPSTPVQLVGSREWQVAWGFGPVSEFDEAFSQVRAKKMGPSIAEEETNQIVRTRKKARCAGLIASLALLASMFIFGLGPKFMILAVLAYFVASEAVEKYFPSALRCPLCKADLQERGDICPSCRSNLKELKW